MKDKLDIEERFLLLQTLFQYFGERGFDLFNKSLRLIEGADEEDCIDRGKVSK